MVLPLIAEALGAALEGAESVEGLEGLASLAKAAPRPLGSRAIATAAWSSGTLTIVMRDGTICAYPGVPEDVYDDLMSASSPGTFYNTEIHGRY
ncbi:KTSC domain-containing protein [Paraburkholderia fungorum]|uniref:KTSC domain-containing protein n=1 Tax=Paraburkholderia fungorum TaxID=134537 RepID=UPI0038B92C44